MKGADDIRAIARDFDAAIEKKEMDAILSHFTEDCVIELLGITLTGKEGVKKWVDWIYAYFTEIRFEPVTILVEGDTFFEEYTFTGIAHNGRTVRSRQVEVLEFEDGRIRALRIYLDRLELAEALDGGLLGRSVVKKIKEASTRDLL